MCKGGIIVLWATHRQMFMVLALRHFCAPFFYACGPYVSVTVSELQVCNMHCSDLEGVLSGSSVTLCQIPIMVLTV